MLGGFLIMSLFPLFIIIMGVLGILDRKRDARFPALFWKPSIESQERNSIIGGIFIIIFGVVMWIYIFYLNFIK